MNRRCRARRLRAKTSPAAAEPNVTRPRAPELAPLEVVLRFDGQDPDSPEVIDALAEILTRLVWPGASGGQRTR